MSHSAVPDYSIALQRISIAILATSAIVVAGTFYVHHTRSVDGASVSIEPAEWPESLRSLLGEAKLDSTGLQVIRLDAFVDHHSLWFVPSDKLRLVDHLIQSRQLQACDGQHAKFAELTSKMPATWPLISGSCSEVFTTQGYGSEFIDGQDLFLVVKSNRQPFAIVMHERIF